MEWLIDEGWMWMMFIACILAIFFLLVAAAFLEGLWDMVEDLEDRVEVCERRLDLP